MFGCKGIEEDYRGWEGLNARQVKNPLRASLGAGPRLSRGTEAPAGIPLARRFPGQRSPTPPPIPVAVWRTEDSRGRPVANKLIAAIRYAATPSKLAVANFYVYTSKFTADNSSTLVATKFHHVFWIFNPAIHTINSKKYMRNNFMIFTQIFKLQYTTMS